MSGRGCGTGAPSQVVYRGDPSAEVLCEESPDQVALVTISQLTGESDGRGNSVSCEQPSIPTCGGRIAFPDQGVAFDVSVTALDAAERAQTILDSATLLPEGFTTVPFDDGGVDARVDALEDAGLEPEVINREFIEDGLVAVLPDLGTPVAVGSTVRLFPFGEGSLIPQARYSTTELQRAALDVTAASESGALPMVYSVEANDLLTALEVSMDRPTVRDEGVTALTEAVEDVAGVDVDLRLGDDELVGGLISAASERLDVGETASITIYVHCGLRTASIDGVQWEIEDREHQPRLHGFTDNFLEGTVTRTADDRAVLWSPNLLRAVVLHPQLAPNVNDGCF